MSKTSWLSTTQNAFRNHGAGGWKVVGHGLAVINEHPDHDDATTARVITLWRRR
jgi:hypothetical protein